MIGSRDFDVSSVVIEGNAFTNVLSKMKSTNGIESGFVAKESTEIFTIEAQNEGLVAAQLKNALER